ncbi:hypothetical protein CXG81DRAFT_12959 [Caulochytrium protostelioides]|uniref:Phosphoglycerate mutase-like protein n=1 Tax=Caulochytrium protostelioides TaxID=1555241 RepID=A0A4P9X669_9FUNG|nr:hypothetical protein CXG81DRAFT_12959 [Caulochytrium protostelioides]|eukprot:RKP00658.1 hypothetical protein CXG81DRAFT_12959 [Caulochytrium protostelioides]
MAPKSPTASIPASPGKFPTTTFILIRHGEKLTWPEGAPPGPQAKKLYEDNALLSAKGHERAFALVGYMLHRAEMTRWLRRRPLAAIVAQHPDDRPGGKGKSCRPYQTVAPLLAVLPSTTPCDGLTSRDATMMGVVQAVAPAGVASVSFYKNDLQEMISTLHAQADAYAGKTVLLCGAHQYLPVLARALGADPASVPSTWPGSRYDVTWVVDADLPGRFAQYPQRLLFSDGMTTIPLDAPHSS